MDNRIIHFVHQLISLTHAQQRVFLEALFLAPVRRGTGDIQRIADNCCVTRQTVSRALVEIRRRPMLKAAIAVTEWRRKNGQAKNQAGDEDLANDAGA